MAEQKNPELTSPHGHTKIATNYRTTINKNTKTYWERSSTTKDINKIKDSRSRCWSSRKQSSTPFTETLKTHLQVGLSFKDYNQLSEVDIIEIPMLYLMT